MFEKLKKDIDAVRERDPAARNGFEVLMMSSGLHAILMHRPANWLYRHNYYLCARAVSQLARFATGIEIHPGAKIGTGVLIDHGMGVVIGETAEVGDGCTIYQGVTLGGTGKDKGKRHPTLGKNVTVGCGAKILGPFKVGDGAKVAANAVLLESIPANATAVGVPARVAHVGGHRVATLDHVHLPDPVSQELCRLQSSLDKLERRIGEIEKSGDAHVDKQEKSGGGEGVSDAGKGSAAPKNTAEIKMGNTRSGKVKPSAADGKKHPASDENSTGKEKSASKIESGRPASDENSTGKVKSAAKIESGRPASDENSTGKVKSAAKSVKEHPVPAAVADGASVQQKKPDAPRGRHKKSEELPMAAEMEHPVPVVFAQK